MSWVETWKRQARRLKRETYALYFAMRDPRVPWYAKALAACVVGYALSPLDLIPDFIPILGFLDDLILIPFGIALVLKLIPPAVLTESRERADAATREQAGAPIAARVATVIIIVVWLLIAAACALWLVRAIRG